MTLPSASLTRGSITSLPGAACTWPTSFALGFVGCSPAAAGPWLTSLVPAESRGGLNAGSFSVLAL